MPFPGIIRKVAFAETRVPKKEAKQPSGHGGEASTSGKQDRSAESYRNSSRRSSVSGTGDSSGSFKAQLYILCFGTSD